MNVSFIELQAHHQDTRDELEQAIQQVMPCANFALQTNLRKRGIGTAVHYPMPVHLQPFYTGNGFRPAHFPVTEQVCDDILSLLTFPEMAADQAQCAGAQVREWLPVSTTWRRQSS